MDGETRRQQIIQLLEENTQPLSGTVLAKRFGVSRQVIVQDIALLKSKGRQIISTYRGYILNQSKAACERVYWVQHTNEQIEDELNTIVDNGGRVCSVVVQHEVYGKISVDLPVHSRRQVKEFVEEVEKGKARPLKELIKDGVHGHLVQAENEKTLDEIENELRKKGYLLCD